jgi:hypothetical protein
VAPEKCSYIIFSQNRKTGTLEKLVLPLYEKFIEREITNNVKFLGIRFDRLFSFKNQADFIKESSVKRLNVLKILSHPSWHLNNQVLVNIYKSLVRSIIDYSLFLFPIISSSTRNKLQRIQNQGLRSILRCKSDEKSVDDLHKELNIEKLADRAAVLRDRYFEQASTNENPLISDLINEFEQFCEDTSWRYFTTILDSVRLDEST